MYFLKNDSNMNDSLVRQLKNNKAGFGGTTAQLLGILNFEQVINLQYNVKCLFHNFSLLLKYLCNFSGTEECQMERQ